MLKWLILGCVVALVSHWSSKEVHADSPLSEGEKELLLKLKETLEGSDAETDKRFFDDSEPCEETCQNEEDYDACMLVCENSMERRMFEEAIAQEESMKRALGSDGSVSKKFVRLPPWRSPRIPPWRAPRVPPWRAPRIPSWRAPRIRSPWGKK